MVNVLDVTTLSDAKRILLEQRLHGNTGLRRIVPRSAASERAPLSLGQQQLWLLDQMIGASTVYSECVTVHISGLLEYTALERALNACIHRHEAWRTIFPVIAGEPVQEVLPALALRLPPVDLCYLSEQDREQEAIRLATIEAVRPFNLATGPLIRPTLVRLGENEHKLFLALHHIIFDGVSIYQIFLPELHELYRSFAAGREPELPELPIQYADYAVWQRARLAQGRFDSQLAYWRRQLGDAPPLLDLPTDFPRRHAHSWHGAMRPFALDRQLTERVRLLARDQGATLYMTLLASLTALFARLSGQDDILMGMALGGRTQHEMQRVMGYFVNPVVMRTDVGGDPTFRELLGRVREVTLEAHAHQELPFEYLVRELRPDRLPGSNPFFQIMFSLEPRLQGLPSGWHITQMDVERGTAKFDLNIEVDDLPDRFIGRWEYRTELFQPETIERWLDHWQRLLAGAVSNPDLPLSQLPLLAPVERRHLLETWQPPQPAASANLNQASRLLTVPERFAEQAKRTPEAIAVSDGKQELTYAQLARRAEHLSRVLRHAGLQKGEYVGLCMERSVGLIVGILGIWQAGGAYVPVDLEWPAARQAEMLQDCGARLVVSQWTVAGQVAQGDWRVLCVPELDEQDEGALPGEEPAAQSLETEELAAERVAYVLYTSGSTGSPKGVMVTHANIARLFQTTEELFHFSARDVWTLFHSYAFDFSVWEMWGALLYGGRLVIVPYLTARNPRAFYRLLQTEQVTVLNQTPSAFRQLIQVDQTAKDDASLALRYVIFGGEALDAQLLAPWFTKHGDRQPQLINMYGITETTVHVSYYPLSRADAEADQGSLIGRPIPDLGVYILDQHRQLVPIGVKGELYVGGPGVARGYLHRPELTADRFITNPFAEEEGARIYKTGDLGRYRPDGTIEYLGRADQQVKLRGFRIELGEIEARLRQHPGVQDVVVLPYAGDHQGRQDGRLAAYVIPERKGILSGRQLKEFLRSQLPDYMVPFGFVMLDTLPLTSNGKLDRRALPHPETDADWISTTFGTATLSLHHQLIRIWEDVLGVHPIGINDDFFDLGGHSLLAVQLVNRIEQVCGKRIPLSALFTGATVAHLAEIILEDGAVAAHSPVVALQAGNTNRPFFFLHGDWDGGGFYSLDLARHLGEDQAFYVLDHPADDASRVTSPTIEALAATHVKALREVQPQGPYRLGGFCIAGLIALEMAQQLQETGEVVEMLALIDAEPAYWELRVARRLLGTLGAIIPAVARHKIGWFTRFRHFAGLVRRGIREIPEALPRAWTLLQRLRSNRTQLEQLFQQARARLRELSPTPATVPAAERWLQLYTWAAAGYVPRTYPGKITLLQAEEDLPKNRRNPAKWCKQLAQAVDFLTVPGSHLTCITTHVHELAATLRTCLDRIGTVWPSSVSVRGRAGLERYRELPRVSVVIPALNEAKNLPHVLPNLPPCVSEAILVDGHSDDDTVEVARRIRQDIKIIKQEGRGKGDALRRGIEASSGNIIVLMDADGSTNPYEIVGFVDALLGGADYAKGSRFIIPGGSDDLTMLRRVGNHFLRRLVNRLFAVQFTDLCYGYNAFWRHGLSSLEADGNGFEIETLLSLRAIKKGLKIVEVPSYEYSRIYGESHLRIVRDGWRVLMTILRERQYSLPVKQQFKPRSGFGAGSSTVSAREKPLSAASYF